MKKQLTLDDIRQAISKTSFSENEENVTKMPDEAFERCTLKEDLGLDSLDLLELTMQLERDHNLEIPYDVEKRVLDYGTVADILEEYNKSMA